MSDKERGDPDAPMTVVVGIVGAILIFVVIVALQALFNRAEEGELARKVVAAAPRDLESVRAEQLERLNGYRWVDRSKGIVSVPIDRAMEKVLAEIRVMKPAATAAGGGAGAPSR